VADDPRSVDTALSSDARAGVPSKAPTGDSARARIDRWRVIRSQPVASAEPATVTERALEARRVNFFYGTFQALSEISLEVPARAITALIGPSGCGKTTFLRIFNRMYDVIPDARVTGHVLFDGVDILDSRVDVTQLRRRVGMLFQRPNPFPKSIYDNVAYAPRLLGWDRARIDHVVEQSLKDTALWDEVKDRLRRSALALSGGQQQRLCLARAIAVQPEILLMDEPCAALDPIATLRIEELMESLKRRYTIVIVTHNMQQASRVSDFTAFMLMNQRRAGELIEFGSTDEIFNRPKDSRTEDYITGRFG
jgi:phosphate transport system ATP-binding protein